MIPINPDQYNPFSINSSFLTFRFRSAYLSSKENFGGLGRMIFPPQAHSSFKVYFPQEEHL